MTNPKIVPLEDLPARIKQLRAAKKKIVATNGCFDLLHVGHVRYLNSARALGDLLIVGLNGDDSVRKLVRVILVLGRFEGSNLLCSRH